jgi:16S rRNA processing protein RimM
MSDTSERSRVVVGKISAVFGVRGQVKVFSYTEPRENILNYGPWMLGSAGQWQIWDIESGQRHGKGIIARLVGCDDRDQALALVGREIAIDRQQLPEVAENEYYWSDLQGLAVITTQGVKLGTVSHLFETGSNDVMVLEGESRQLIPYIWGQVVIEVDLDAGQLVVDWDPEF